VLDALAHGYFQRALLAGLLAGAACGVVGVYVITAHLALLGVCIAHAAFAGALFSLWLGVPPLAGAVVFSLAAVALVGPVAERGRLSPDAAIGVLFSLMLGLAFVFMALTPGSRTESLGLLWGSILTVTRAELVGLGAVALVVGALVTLFYKEIQAVLCHRPVAVGVGIPAGLVFYAMLVATGLTVAVSLRSLGGLLVYSLMLNPAAAAFQLTWRLHRMLALAALFGVASCWAGLAASYWWDLPAGACAVLASCVVFAAAAAVSPKRRAPAEEAA
jgi:manganese/iron transport system permease protein